MIQETAVELRNPEMKMEISLAKINNIEISNFIDGLSNSLSLV